MPSIIHNFLYTKLEVTKAISGYEEIAEKNQRKSDWLIYQKDKFSLVGYSYEKLSRSLPKSKNNEEIKKEKKWEYQRTEVTNISMIKEVKMKNRDYHEGDWAF